MAFSKGLANTGGAALTNDTPLSQSGAARYRELTGSTKEAPTVGNLIEAQRAAKSADLPSNRLTEVLGEEAARAYVAKNFSDYQPVKEYNGKGAGTLDLLYVNGEGSSAKYLVVEAKGGTSRNNGSRMAKDARGKEIRAQQGTPEYLQSVIAEMKRKEGMEKVADDLSEAKKDGRIQYIMVSQPLDGAAPGEMTASEFGPSRTNANPAGGAP